MLTVFPQIKQSVLSLLLTCLLLSHAADAAGSHRPGIQGKKAPAFSVTEWINLKGEQKTFDLEDLEGKVIYLYCFQSWCPGCHSRGFPTLKEVIKDFADDDAVGIVAIQTTFEGFSSNTFERAKAIAKKYDLHIPIGQSGTAGSKSKIMQNYRTGGTPWTIIIDKNGVVRYNDFHITAEAASKLIRKLKSS